jgi:hypothetical protein
MKAQAKIDEFIWVFLVGAIAIVVMLFAWGTPPEENGGNVTNITEYSNVFTVGLLPQDVPRNIRIGDFDVSFAIGSTTLSEKRNVEIKRSVFENKDFTMSGRIEQDMSLITSGFLIIDVLDTNSLGNLIVKVNDEVVFNQKVNPGEVNIPIDKNVLKSYNVIEVSTSGLGLQVWSTGYYKLERILFGINFFGNVEKVYDFQLYEEELKNFKSGEVAFTIDNRDGSGDLTVRMNGKILFRGVPSRIFRQSFDLFDVGLVKGINDIRFSTETGTSYKIDDAEVIITHEEVGSKSRSFSFSVSDSDYDKLKKGNDGRINFIILDSNYLGNLMVTIKDANGNENPADVIQSYSIGDEITIAFDKNDVKPGTNVVIFDVSGSGSFILSNLDIMV